jgi:hypothetical protein
MSAQSRDEHSRNTSRAVLCAQRTFGLARGGQGKTGANGSEGVWKPSPEEGKEGGRTSSFEERSADGPETGAIAQLNPGSANEEFVGILEPKGFLSRFVSSEAMREGARPTADCLLRSSSDLRGR